MQRQCLVLSAASNIFGLVSRNQTISSFKNPYSHHLFKKFLKPLKGMDSFKLLDWPSLDLICRGGGV